VSALPTSVARDRSAPRTLGKDHVVERRTDSGDDIEREDDHPDDSGGSASDQAKAREEQMEETGEENAA
jgi:hypothetical protein